MRQRTRRRLTKFPADTHVTPSLTPLQLHNVPQPSKYKMYINFEVHLWSLNCYSTPQAISPPLFFCHLTRYLKSYLHFLPKEWANSEAGCPRSLGDTWKTIVKSPKQTQASSKLILLLVRAQNYRNSRTPMKLKLINIFKT